MPLAAPGALPEVNKLLPMELDTVKSPLVVSCHTAVAMPAGVSEASAGGEIVQPVVNP